MKYVGMVLGGILSAMGHMIAFIFKNAFIAIRRFSMDPANKNIMWNLQAMMLLVFLLLCFFWLIGKYQDLYYGVSGPIFYRVIPLLITCFLGHIIYSCPALFKNSYAKPVIQTFLNGLSLLALGQIILSFVPFALGMVITVVLFITGVAVTLYYTLHINIKSTVFNKLKTSVEQFEMQQALDGTSSVINRIAVKKGISKEELLEVDEIDLGKKGCLSHLRYYSEECKLQLFMTLPTRERQSQLMTLSRDDRAQHEQYIGGTGSGKTLLATNMVVQDLLNDYIGSTIIEPKGSFINRLANFMDRTGRTYYRLDPENEFSDCMNPFYVPVGEDIEPMIEANVSAFHGYLGPDAEQYFKSRSTQLFRVGIKALKLAKGNDCTYNDLNRLIQPINDDFRAEILSQLSDQLPQVSLLLEYTRNIAGKMQEHTMKTYSNLYDYLSELTSNKYIQRIFCGPSTFNIDDVIKNGGIVLVNGAYGKLQTLTYTVGRLYINLLKASTFRRNLLENVRPHCVTIDEVQNFVDEEFSTFFEMAREFEVYMRVIHQGNAQLTDVSERLGSMIKQNAVQKFILAGLDPDDATFYADLIGEDYKIGQSSGTDEMSANGFKTQIKEEKRYEVMPSEILRLKGYNGETGEPGECLFRGVHNNVRLKPVIGLVFPLPRKLFSPLESSDRIEALCEEVVENEKNQANEVRGETREASNGSLKDYLASQHDGLKSEKEIQLERIQKKASVMRNKESSTRQLAESNMKSNEGIGTDPSVFPFYDQAAETIRNPLWDSFEETTDKAKQTETDEVQKSIVTFMPANIDDTTLRLAQRIKIASEEKRNNTKGNSGAE
ncbi:type IV secretory system conjugative DNA transfer family protein [Paenibacillus sp. NPDC056579]|uniref:type IV secretory system conjugative DNA transfer family protein n=1 Tax=Paenibacillus sp. NPDC056579 TaxID=3345871 RepID=UPI003679AAAF